MPQLIKEEIFVKTYQKPEAEITAIYTSDVFTESSVPGGDGNIELPEDPLE